MRKKKRNGGSKLGTVWPGHNIDGVAWNGASEARPYSSDTCDMRIGKRFSVGGRGAGGTSASERSTRGGGGGMLHVSPVSPLMFILFLVSCMVGFVGGLKKGCKDGSACQG